MTDRDDTYDVTFGEFMGARATEGSVWLDYNRGYARLEQPFTKAELDALYSGTFWAEKGNEQKVRYDTREWWRLHYDDWLSMVGTASRHRRPATNAEPRWLLDVGCGFGYFIQAANELGWNAHGCDPSPDAIREARSVLDPSVWHSGLRDEPPVPEGELTRDFGGWVKGGFGRVEYGVVRGDMSDVRRQLRAKGLPDEECYDALSALWVMEHLLDPEAFLIEVFDLLKTGGVFLAAVPNDFSEIQMRVVAEERTTAGQWWIDRTHINYWTPATFANLLGRAGFKIVDQTTMYPMEQFILDGFDYPARPELGARLHGVVRECERDPRYARADVYRRMARAGQGREIVVVAVKD